MNAPPHLPLAPEYPQLVEIANSELAVDVLRAHMGPRFAAGELDLSRLEIERAYYTPGPRGSCRLRLRAAVADRRGQHLGDQVFCGQLWPRSALADRVEQAQRRTLSFPEFGEPLSVVSPWDMILWAFPNDPEILHVSALARPEQLLARAKAHPQRFGLPPGAPLAAARSDLVKYVPARRCTWKCAFEVELEEARVHEIYAKMYRRRDGRRTYERLSTLFAAAREAADPPRLPEPHGYDEELDTILCEALPGRPLTSLLADRRLPALAQRAGRALASLHALEADLPERRTLRGELDELSEKGDAIVDAFPRYAARCEGLRERLRRTAAALGEGRHCVIHGAFRLSHVLSHRDHIAFIDLDGAGLGDPDLDLGRLAAHLVEMRIAGRLSTAQADEALRALIRGYEARSGRASDPARIRWFSASQLLTGQIYKSVKRRESPQLPALLAAAEELCPTPRAPAGTARRGHHGPSDATAGPPLDPALPHLDLLVDPDRMRPLLERILCETGAGSELSVAAADLEKVNYRVGRYGAALYRLRLSGSAASHWFHVRHGGAEETRLRFEAARPDPIRTPSGAPGLAHWPEHQLLVWAFPADPRLGTLARVIDPDALRARIEGARRALGLAPEARPGSVDWEAIKLMPGKRCVLRFEVELEAAGGSAPLRFFSKTYRDARSRRVHAAIESTRAALAATGAALEIPRTLLHLDDLHTSWQVEWRGRSLSDLHGTPELAAMLPLVARSLGELHAAKTALPAAGYVSETAGGALRDAQRIAQYLPQATAHARAIAERLVRQEPGLPEARSFPEATLHGAFRLSQLLRRSDRLALVDFDAIARGDPHYDVAEFQASLLYQAFRRDLALPGVRAHADAFRAEYEKASGWQLDDARLAWFEAAFLLEKLYLSLKSIERALYPRVGEILELADVALDRVTPR